jgi:hypothetical protein
MVSVERLDCADFRAQVMTDLAINDLEHGMGAAETLPVHSANRQRSTQHKSNVMLCRH